MNYSQVNVWEEKVTIPTYAVGTPDKNPMFFEKRVYQGSSGKVYPNPVIEKIYDEKSDKEYAGIFIENKYIKVLILPELGGRIQMAYDKIKERHFVYYNQVIKPALVGLTGPWISGGIEFNWPQHHRPSTFEPVDHKIEHHADGSKTVWVNEVERMFHTKGMAGFTLYPDRAYIEIKAKLYNRSALPQTFLWWANPAVKVNDDYQSVFPPDVNAVFDHGKRDVSTFPIATGTYYKVDYSPGTDISRYKNIPVPTSYMAINSRYDFVGGYEHDTKAGLLHVANHHVSPGKKQWTWGHSDFGLAWDRNLTDEDGPYIELMTGMFTDNQPDFTWLMPNEQKHFTQYFLPYRELGVVKNASKDILLALDVTADSINLKVFVTGPQKSLKIKVIYEGVTIFESLEDIVPEQVFVRTIPIKNPEEQKLLLTIHSSADRELLRYQPADDVTGKIPEAAKPALQPEEVENNEQLFLTGQHLEQYRHATYHPLPYYNEALKRDPKDIRNNNALGAWYLRRGAFAKSEPYFRKAVETSVSRNPNPFDSECYYNLGLALKFQGRPQEAYPYFYKATWSNAWKDSSFFSLAQIDLLNGDYELALEHTEASLDCNANNSKSYVLRSAAYRKLGKLSPAMLTAYEGLRRDPFNFGLLYELVSICKLLGENEKAEEQQAELLSLSRGYEQTFMEYALDYANAGLFEEATGLLEHANSEKPSGPMVSYYMGYFKYQNGDRAGAEAWLSIAAAADSYLCFPDRLEDIGVLTFASALKPGDAKAPYYLGNLFYDKQQYDRAIECWEASAALDQTYPTALRNLGIAYFNKNGNQNKAVACFEKAFALDPADARVLMELDQLYKRLNYSPDIRLSFLQKYVSTAAQRDDVYLEIAALHNFTGSYHQALEMISNRTFHPWEGGEGKASGQYVYSLIQIAREAISESRYMTAIESLERARTYPVNLGEGKLFGKQENDIFYWLGIAYEGAGDTLRAEESYNDATTGLSEPSAAVFYNDQQPDQIFYQGLAWRKLGDDSRAEKIFNSLVNYGKQHMEDEVKIDYFAVSLPNLLIFDDDLTLRNTVHCLFLMGLGYLGLEKFEEAGQFFREVLTLDAMHFGAAAHMSMAKYQLR
jgi:tetratricopeptide (TPR) repeat protein